MTLHRTPVQGCHRHGSRLPNTTTLPSEGWERVSLPDFRQWLRPSVRSLGLRYIQTIMIQWNPSGECFSGLVGSQRGVECRGWLWLDTLFNAGRCQVGRWHSCCWDSQQWGMLVVVGRGWGTGCQVDRLGGGLPSRGAAGSARGRSWPTWAVMPAIGGLHGHHFLGCFPADGYGIPVY